MNERCAKQRVRVKDSEVQSKKYVVCMFMSVKISLAVITMVCFFCGRADVTPYVWCAYAHLTSFRGEEGKQRLLVQLEC